MIAAAFAIYSTITTENYRQLRTDEISKTVAFESERVGKVIAEMERNAIDLALMGRQYYQTYSLSASEQFRTELPIELGISISVENFSAFKAAVGGGIWFEPYAIDPGAKRVCYCAFFDAESETVQYNPDFESDEYDYLSQMWYMTIAGQLAGRSEEHGVVWTEPYNDGAGTNALMTTVGAGIYDDSGRLVGISTVDWEIQSVVDSLSAIKPTANSFVLLASDHDDYIISDTQAGEADMTGQSLRVIPWHKYLDYVSDGTVRIGNFADGGVEYMSFSRMFDNGWFFSVIIPAHEIFQEIEARNEEFVIIIAGAFLIFMILTAYLLSRIVIL